MLNAALQQYAAKLERRRPFTSDDREALLTLPGVAQSYRAGDIIIAEGVAASHFFLVAKGFVSRSRRLSDGSSQIVAFRLPGDSIDLQSVLFTQVDETLRAHSATTGLWIAHAKAVELANERPLIAMALWLDTLVDARISREWTTNIGQRHARARIAHLLLELAARCEAIGMLRGEIFELPVTQPSLADAVGLSLVHFNKSIRALCRDGLIEIEGRWVKLLDRKALIEFCGFDSAYLHLDGTFIKDFSAIYPSIQMARLPALKIVS